ncbi:HLH domain-containing protein [Oryctes borbonicus]|uniref:HLH domain-containing protein n=1 Tax=Oryctes borbonicus TaxID=1629725 RepID=A0A0T6B7K3_9SCAR|nr:HLH domain-containing protein [Oryctes borbonicus]
MKLLWLTLSQVYSSCEIEFLPVYNPSDEEKRDPKLFAHNVRAVMAKALGVPVMDYTYDDCKLITRAKEMNLPNSNALLEVQKIRHKLKLDDNRTEEYIVNSKLLCQNCSRLTFLEFANYLNVPCTDPLLQQLFRLYDKNSSGVIDFREYLLGVLGLPFTRSIIDTVKIAFKIYDRTGQGKIPAEDLAKILSHTLAMPYSEAVDTFQQVAKSETEFVTFEQLSAHLERKAEFASLFTISKEEKMKSRNGEICPNDYKKNN